MHVFFNGSEQLISYGVDAFPSRKTAKKGGIERNMT